MTREELAERLRGAFRAMRGEDSFDAAWTRVADAALDAMKPTANDKARTDSPIVAAALNAGLSPLAAIQPLVALTDRLVRRVIELERIAPRAIVTPDGRKLIWRCPDEFVPTNEIRLAADAEKWGKP